MIADIRSYITVQCKCVKSVLQHISYQFSCYIQQYVYISISVQTTTHTMHGSFCSSEEAFHTCFCSLVELTAVMATGDRLFGAAQ